MIEYLKIRRDTFITFPLFLAFLFSGVFFWSAPVFGTVCLFTKDAGTPAENEICEPLRYPSDLDASEYPAYEDNFCLLLETNDPALNYSAPRVCPEVEDCLGVDPDYLIRAGVGNCRSLQGAGTPDVPSGGEGPLITQPTQLPAVKLDNPLGDITSIPLFVGRIINYILGILGALTLFVFFDGAFNWVTSLGSPQRVEKGLHAMFFAVVGLLVIFAAYGILRNVLGAITGTV